MLAEDSRLPEPWSSTGVCKGDIANYCKDLSAGEGTLAACLTKRIKEEASGNVVGEFGSPRAHNAPGGTDGDADLSCPPSTGRKVLPKCKRQLSQFKIDRSRHINKDVPLGKLSPSCARLPA